ncbi:MAG: hypothetical protein KatS3mg076_1635 [Candidatus Binatia bacterium]|nr:MAG: hypothetical protein KatS3mg076_1635 [Candidatus Binatia bacterium]
MRNRLGWVLALAGGLGWGVSVASAQLVACPDPDQCVKVSVGSAEGRVGDVVHVEVSFEQAPSDGATGGPEAAFLVCDVVPSSGDDAGQFGNGTINNADIVAIFRASLLATARPPADTARFSAMDSAPPDNPPVCGGNGSLVNSDVVTCFRQSLLPSLPRYDRQGLGEACVSSIHQ